MSPQVRLAELSVSGFRGIRSELSVEFPRGFLVISGRNGSGKTSVCDAVDFALTGSISWREGETERRERIQDYIWWRGRPEARERYVRLKLVDEETGEIFEIERRPGDEGESTGLESVLTRPDEAPEGAIARLCELSVIRDEAITQLSVESAERDRYRMVKEAVGAPIMPMLRERAGNLAESLSLDVKEAETIRKRRQEEVNSLLEERSELSSQLSEVDEVEAAERILRELADVNGEAALSELAAVGRQEVAHLETRLGRIDALHGELRELSEEDEELEESAEAIASRLEEQQEHLARHEEELAEACEQKKFFEEEHPEVSNLSSLVESGRSIGLREGRCPLCGSEVPEVEYAQHIKVVQEEVTEFSEELALIKSRIDGVTNERDAVKETVAASKAELSEVQEKLRQHRKRRNRLMARLSELGVEVADREDGEALNDTAGDALAEIGERISKLEVAISRVESSRVAEELEELEERLETARDKAIMAEKQLNKYQEAQAEAKSTEQHLSRYEGKIVDEQLHSLKPLLQEFYLRLRPHVDWREVDYQLRGDIQRFLSLTVGDGLNPRFLFSSGQRRASGLAFLFAVYMSTTESWSNFRTLVLDDPVQHIDDYRAIHIAEVLSAIRRTGRQVVVAVEDADLARLMCRRLNIGPGNGSHVYLEYEVSEGCRVAREEAVLPFETHILDTG